VESLRKPFFIAALVLITLALIVELGAAAVLGEQAPSGGLEDLIAETEDPDDREALGEALDELDAEQLERVLSQDKPPGLAIRYMALIDGILLFTVGMIGVAILIRERAHAKVHGCVTALFSLLMALGSCTLLIVALASLLLMVALLLAVPFGTIAYLVLYGFFNRPGAAATLALIMTLRIGFAACLVLAQQRFLQNKSLVLLIVTAFLASMIVSCLHGIVPRFLVSITDALAAIIIGILAVIWAVFLLIASIPAVLRVLNLSRA
jgi:hypothetical protein